MSVEIPECKRCCCCVPLRYGLIMWGYINLLLALFLLVTLSYSLNFDILNYPKYYSTISNMVIQSQVIVLDAMQIILSVVFIIGCHKKNVRIMKIYCFYQITSTIILSSLGTYDLLSYIVQRFYSIFEERLFFFNLVDSSMIFSTIVTQTYLVLLVKSEITKLNKGCQLRFVNNAVEAECNLQTNQHNETTTVEDKKDTESVEEHRIYI